MSGKNARLGIWWGAVCLLNTEAHVMLVSMNLSSCRCVAKGAYLDKGMEEAQPKQQLLEGSRLLTVVEEGRVADWVIQVALQQVGSQALQYHTCRLRNSARYMSSGLCPMCILAVTKVCLEAGAFELQWRTASATAQLVAC